MAVREGPIWIAKEAGIASLNTGCWIESDERDRLTVEVSHHLRIDEMPDGAEVGTVEFHPDGTMEFALNAEDIEQYGFDPSEGAIARRVEA